ncbi:MAG: hypothetical protein K6T83_05105 [Alicyclobacillus sp.]|nr:hypothetical protein [Alicyclobacillus sp.]
MYHGLITEQSRKAKAARSVYDYLRQKLRPKMWETIEWNSIEGYEGIRIPDSEKHRVLNLRIQEEHLSPYFKTDMNLFHLLMLDDSADMRMFRTDRGWLFVFEGIPDNPKPFGQSGYDLR